MCTNTKIIYDTVEREQFSFHLDFFQPVLIYQLSHVRTYLKKYVSQLKSLFIKMKINFFFKYGFIMYKIKYLISTMCLF